MPLQILVAPEVENASAGIHKRQHTIIIRRRNVAEKANVEFDLVSNEVFKRGLAEMGVEEEKISRLSRESGQSLTVLRRRLSDIPAIKSPLWAEDNLLARKLIPLGFIGTWNSLSKADNKVLSFLSDDNNETVERLVASLLCLDDSPVWSANNFHGVVSKLDILYAVHESVTRNDLENFFRAAPTVLSERDPSLDLSEEKRYMADIYGKRRDHSSILRANVCETLVLLAIHGDELFKKRLGFDVESNVNELIKNLLMPFGRETWMSQKEDLPLYAEAAPDCFLDILEEDLKTKDPKVLSLLKPAESGIFGSKCPRSGLLWALELLAWKPERLLRVAKILAQMSEIKIADNWNNKPENSLKSIFLSWMPQTAASVDQRYKVLEKIIHLFPRIGWRLCIAQFNGRSTVGGSNYPNYRPRWRTDAYGAGQPPIATEEALEFARKALALAIDWPTHKENTLGDLIQCIKSLNQTDQGNICARVNAWIATNPTDEKKAVLREKIRLNFFTRHTSQERKPSELSVAIQKIYCQLEATDLVVRYQWLFARYWIEESWDEFEDEELNDYQNREEKVARMRAKAIAEIWKESGFDGIIRLCRKEGTARIVGSQLAILAPADFDQAEFITRIIAESSLSSLTLADNYLSGYLTNLDENAREKLLLLLIEGHEGKEASDDDVIIRILKYAPCKKSTWQIVDRLCANLQKQYWLAVEPYRSLTGEGELRELVEKLLLSKRPRAALRAVQFSIEKLDSPMIVQLLKDVATVSSETDVDIRFQPHDIARVFEILDIRTDVSCEELAQLEFLYLYELESEARGIPNLERQLSETPSLFAYAVGLSYKRKGEGEDPPEWQIPDEKIREHVALQACSLLDKAKRIPGTGEDGKIDSEKLRSWIQEAQQLCRDYGRKDGGDACIGELLSKSGYDDSDGIWPAIAVRNILEEIGNPIIMDQMIVGLYNQRGVQYGAFEAGGNKERDRAAMYRDWSKQIAFDWPFTARLLEKIAKSCDDDATCRDADANLRKRLPF